MALPSSPMYGAYGVNVPSYGVGMPQYSYLPAGGSGMGGDSGGPGIGDDLGSSFLMGGAPAVGGQLLTNIFGMINANKQAQLNRQAQANLQTNSLQAETGANTQRVAVGEANRDPFTNRMQQMSDASKLDRVANATYSRPQLNLRGPFAQFKPTMTGGYSYQKSPALVSAARAAQQSVLAGNPDPSMTNPSNYGKTGALDLLSASAGTKDPTKTSSFATGAPAGASTLGSDPVAAQIRNAYHTYLGRDPSDNEIQNTIGTLGQIYNRPITAADSNLIAGWAQNNLATSPEAQANKASQPSYMGAGG